MSATALMVAGIASSLLGGALGFAGRKNANYAAKQEAARQRQHEIDLWNMQNAYNTPAQQVARLKAAGINPSLYYSRGGVDNTSGDVGAGVVASLQQEMTGEAFNRVMPIISQFSDMRLKNAQAHNLDENARLTAYKSLYEDESRPLRIDLLGKQSKNYDFDWKNKNRYYLNDVARMNLQRDNYSFEHMLETKRYRLQQRNMELNMSLAINQDKRLEKKLSAELLKNHKELRMLDKNIDMMNVKYSQSLNDLYFKNWQRNIMYDDFNERGIYSDSPGFWKFVERKMHSLNSGLELFFKGDWKKLRRK